METKQIDISWESIFKIIIIFFGCYIVYLIKDVIVWIVFASIVSISFESIISSLEKRRINRTTATLIVYVLFFVLLGLFVSWIMPIFVSEIQQFTRLFPQYFDKLSPFLQGMGIEVFKNMETFTTSVQGWIIKASSNIFSAIVSLFGGILSTVTIFTLAIFFSIEREEIKKIIRLFIPQKREKYLFDLWDRCQLKTTAWINSSILNSLFVVLASYITFIVFKIKYSLALSLLAGITDFIPIVGPVFAGIVIAFFALLDSWTKSLFVVIVFILIQQVESSIVGPISNKKIIGLPATLTLISLLVGARLWGVLGAILSVPLASIIYEFLKDLLKNKSDA